jgi:lysophospholipase L1-like esterase
MKTCVCFGASLTAGTVSYNFLHLLKARPALVNTRFINRGVNGDVAWSGLQRLDEVIEDRPDYISILIGTNDVNSTLGEENRLRYRDFYKLPQDPTMEWYEESLREIVVRLKKETSAKIALMSLSVIGEDLAHRANAQVVKYNAVIRQIAEEEGVAYLPLFERMVEYLDEHAGERTAPRLEYRPGLHNIGTAMMLHSSGLSWDDISKRNGLLLTTDTLHLNSVGAGMIADLVEEWLTSQ